jgi:hypothetical protein
MPATPDTHMADAVKLTDVLIDITKRWPSNEDVVDGRVIALAYARALGAFLAQVLDHGDRTLLVMKTCETLISVTNVPLQVKRWNDLPTTKEQKQ